MREKIFKVPTSAAAGLGLKMFGVLCAGHGGVRGARAGPRQELGGTWDDGGGDSSRELTLALVSSN